MFELSFSKNIKKFRKDNNLSQKEFADLLQVSRTTLIAYEKGTTEPTLYVAFRAAKVMNCSLDALVGIDTPSNKLELYSQLDSDLSMDYDQDIKNKLTTLNALIKKYRRSFEDLTMSKKRTDRMLNELTMSKKRNDFIYEELKRTLNRVQKSEDQLLDIVDKFSIDDLNIDIDDYDSYDYISVPEYGNIACGRPNEIHDNLVDFIKLPIIAPLSLNNSENYFIITASGDSMNQLCQNGEKIILMTTEYDYIPNQHDVLAIQVDDCITLKELFLCDDKIILKPKSNDSKYTDIIYELSDFNTLIIKGKYICTVNEILDKRKELSK